MVNLAPPPKKDNPRYDEWMTKLYQKIMGAENSAGGTSDHAQLNNLNSSTYSHVTGTQASALTAGGTTALHYHAADRDRSTHTGTQAASTISDFNNAVQTVLSSSVLESQIFGS